MSLIPTVTSNKARIAKQFSRAAETYDLAAQVQLDIALDAMSALVKRYHIILDLGCGTGRVSHLLADRCDNLVAMDLAFGMLSYAASQRGSAGNAIQWVQADAEHLPLADHSVDGLFSSMALQWCHHPTQVMAEIQRVMKPQSEAILAIMCEGSFEQLKYSWQQVDDNVHVNSFASPDTWYQGALEQGLTVNMWTKAYTTWHQDIRHLLSSIKSIGANVLLARPTAANTAQLPLSRKVMQQLENSYQKKYAENTQLPLTYQVCFLHCIKS
jgi:malonyl-CoA O-methyltransferase